MPLLNRRILDNTLAFWAAAAGASLAMLLLLLALRAALRGPLGHMLSRLPGKIDDVAVETLAETRGLFLLALSLYAGSFVLRIPRDVRSDVNLAMIVVAFIQAGRWVQTFVTRAVAVLTPEDADAPSRVTLGAAVAFLTNLTVWSVVLLLILQNLGVEIGALMAGLGVGGVATALAAQSLLKDLIASLSIYLDRPFDIGDAIAVGEFSGVVQKVGLRSTRMTAVGGEHVVLPNGEVTSKGIRNFRRMHERRVVTVIRIAYDSPFERVKQVPGMLQEVVSAHPDLRFDRAHFRGYGDYGLEFELVYIVLTADYRRYMDLQQNVNLEIMRRLEELGLRFGLPGRPVQESKNPC